MRRFILLAACAALIACPGENSTLSGEGAGADFSADGGLSFGDVGAVVEGGVVGDGPSSPDTFVDPNDLDGDGLSNDEEKKLGTDPLLDDTDNDGIKDKTEVGSAQAPKDEDGDGQIDALEPNDFDSDKDGTPDSKDNDNTDGPCGSLPRLFANATLNTSAKLKKSCSPYKVLGALFVLNKAQLSAEAGVEVRFGPRASLQIGNNAAKGELWLKGATGSAVVLTADSKTPQPGYWRGVVLENAKPLNLTNVEIRWAGGATNGGDPQAQVLIKASNQIAVTDSVFEDGAGAGIHSVVVNTSARHLLAFHNNKFARLKGQALALNVRHVGELEGGNDFGGAEVGVLGTDIKKDSKWRALGAGSRYAFSENSVNVNAELILEAGVSIDFATNTEFRVGYLGKGRLETRGTQAEPVTLSSVTAKAGSWTGLIFSSGKNALTQTKVIGGGRNSTTNTEAGIYVGQSGSLKATTTTITDSAAYGAYLFLNNDGCKKLVTPAGLVFSGAVAKCKLFCLDDTNSPGVCSVP